MASVFPANPGAMPPTPPTGWQRFSRATVSAYHAYASWLVSITWKRFALLSLLLIFGAAMLSDLLSWSISEVTRPMVVIDGHKAPTPPAAPKAPREPAPPALPKAPQAAAAPKAPAASIEAPSASSAEDRLDGLDISIGKDGVQIHRRNETPAVPEHQASNAASTAPLTPSASGVSADGSVHIDVDGEHGRVVVKIPPGADSETVREAIQDAKDSITEAIQDAKEAAHDTAQAQADAAQALRDAAEAGQLGTSTRTRTVKLAGSLPQFAVLWVVASIILKITYKGRIQAEVKAAQAVETAEAESLKRQVVEARMAAMQAQVEPHFLFNTLASIDHLIETDPPRASKMQKNLITLLRASMPTMREASDGGARALGRELGVIRPYLEILKVRMEERLTTEINVSDGLLSAAFPPMMIQTLVENAVKHGLEPKPEGGHLKVSAEVVHGKLAVTVADTGVGFGNAATAGTGVGLANIRERLQLLYGAQATLSVVANSPAGTLITITVPYKSIEGAQA